MKSPYPAHEEICLAALGRNQAFVKQIDYALKEAIKHITDRNKDVSKKLTVTATITIKSDKTRDNASIECSVKTNFPGDIPVLDMVFIDQRGNGAVPMIDQLELGGITGVDNDEEAGNAR